MTSKFIKSYDFTYKVMLIKKPWYLGDLQCVNHADAHRARNAAKR
jgi:hypothetical protein